MPYTTTHQKIEAGIIALSLLSWNLIPAIVTADNDDDDYGRANGRASAQVKARIDAAMKREQNENKEKRALCITVPRESDNGAKKTPACQAIPRRILKLLKTGKKEQRNGVDTIAPLILEIRVTGITDTSAVIHWKTDEKSTAQVAFGTTATLGSFVTFDGKLKKPHAVRLTGLQPATTYYFKVQSTDANKNLATSTLVTFATDPTPPPAPDRHEPVMSSVSVGTLTETSATVSWTTDEPADSLGIAVSADATAVVQTAFDPVLLTTHEQTFTGLKIGTTYFGEVRSRDAAGNLAVSSIFTFKTSGDSTAPTVSAVQVSTITETAAEVSWTTNEAATSQIVYGASASYGASTTLDTTLATAHKQVLAGLTAGVTYHFQVQSKDAQGNLSASADLTFTTATDSTAPVITEVSISTVTSGSAIVNWTTNEPSRSTVYFSKTASLQPSGAMSVMSTLLLTHHSLLLFGLDANTKYYFVVEATDAKGNVATAAEASLTTAL